MEKLEAFPVGAVASMNLFWVLGGGHYQNQTFCYNLCIMARISSQVSRNKQRVKVQCTHKGLHKSVLSTFLFVPINYKELHQLPKKGIRRSLMYLLEIFIQHSFLKTTFYEANQVLKMKQEGLMHLRVTFMEIHS